MSGLNKQGDIARAIESVVSSFSGQLGIAATNLETGEEVAWNADQLLPIASVLKVPVLLEVLQQAEEGRISLDEPIAPMATHRTFGSGVLKELSNEVRMSVHDLAILMIVLSDNTATNALIALVGGVAAVNARMQRLGFPSITLHSNIPLPHPIEPGQPMPKVRNVAEARPVELANLFAGIARDRVASREVCEGMLAILRRQQFVDQVPRYFEYDSIGRELGLVQRVGVACKTGFHPGTRCDAGLVTLGSETGQGPRFAYAVLNTGSTDTSMSAEAEGAVANARIGRLLLEHWWPPELGRAPLRDLPSWVSAGRSDPAGSMLQ